MVRIAVQFDALCFATYVACAVAVSLCALACAIDANGIRLAGVTMCAAVQVVVGFAPFAVCCFNEVVMISTIGWNAKAVFAGTFFPADRGRAICRGIATVFRRIGFAFVIDQVEAVCAGRDMTDALGTGHRFCVCRFFCIAVMATRAAMRRVRGGVHAGVIAIGLVCVCAGQAACSAAARHGGGAFGARISAALLGVWFTGVVGNMEVILAL